MVGYATAEPKGWELAELPEELEELPEGTGKMTAGLY
jgi:hypothetical protein